MSLAVRAMTRDDMPTWDRFVLETEGGSFFHLSGWSEIFSRAFGLVPHYLIAEQDGVLAGILPLVHQKSRLFGNALIAAPFLVEGGPLAVNAQARETLDEAALALKRRTGAAYVEFRSRTASRPGWASRKGLYATFKRPLSASDEENLLAIPRKQRAVVRKALSSTLDSAVESSPENFFPVYAESVRNLGTPVFARRYFAMLLEVFPDHSDIVTIRDKGRPVSAVLNFYFKDTVLPYYGGGTAEARRSGANDFLYWEVMRRAALRGYRQFDFGRSKDGTGAFKFKKNWGFEPQWLEYEYFLDQGESLPEKNPNNPRYKFAIEAWKRLPLPLANFLGPFLIAGLG
ncbi:MAG TPA: FemAB family XrtA/PEP-CTERM system-associated protein [Rhizomicrobium sp.]|nr:FemAB family XrtA/PEP-CTERM system-associated protein [Rhizomicrobium sp.]